MLTASAGTMESNDCLMIVSESDQLKIDLESIVYKQFKDQIEKVIRDTLKEKGYQKLHVHCQDKGALDYTIKARLLTALERLEKLK
ncbi:MAG: citrate lyase acyl carrier protein [Acholeplasmataceae bacterium]|nr:citrate lyase acyl carrier protein [Acholeplasmataceae bacterium]